MKRLARFLSYSSLLLCCLVIAPNAFAKKGCEFSILGTWQSGAEKTPHATNAHKAETHFYRFAPDGTVTVLAGADIRQADKLREVARATYKVEYLDETMMQMSLAFTPTQAGEVFAPGTTTLEIRDYNETSFTCAKEGAPPQKFIKVETDRYFLILAGRRGTFYDGSGESFSMLVKQDGRQSEVKAIGIHAIKGKPVFGVIPQDVYKEFMKEPRRGSTDVLLRLEINGAQYGRALKSLATWERRIRENALLYPDVALDNILVVKEVTEALNTCSQQVALYNLDWGEEDMISDHNAPSLVPYLYFKELRRMNDALHVRDAQFSSTTQLRLQKASR